MNILAGSTIRQAYLLGGRCGNVASQQVTLNGFNYFFNAGNMASPCFTTGYGGTGCGSGVHAIDITADINPLTTLYTMVVGAQNSVSNKYPEFYVVIAFDNGSMGQMSTIIYLQDQDVADTMNWTCNTTAPIITTDPAGFAAFGGYGNVTATDCEELIVNGTSTGAYQGTDFNANSVYGAMGAFEYYNGILTGYGDDNANQAVSGTDALSNIQAIVPNNTTSFPVSFVHCPGGSATDNHVWAGILAYGSNVSLPAEMTSFNVKNRYNKEVMIEWNTASQSNTDHFVVQRSRTGKSFEEIGTVKAAGNSTTELAYSFVDESPDDGVNYYRIKTLDRNGAQNHTAMKSVMISHENGFLISGIGPIPADDHLDFTVNINNPTEPLILQVYDNMGKQVVLQQLTDLPEGTSQQTLQTNQLSKGIYFVRFTHANQELTRKLLINR